MRTKSIYVLGTGLSHDGSACLLRDGKISVAIEKERLTRRKHDGGNDSIAIDYCLTAEGISLSDVDLVVQNGNFTMFEAGNNWFRGSRPFSGDTRVVTISHHLAHAYSAVARSPFQESAVLVVDGCGSSLDDCIDLPQSQSFNEIPQEMKHCYFEKDSLYHFDAGRLKSVYKDFSPWGFALKEYPLRPPTTMHSIGGLYQAVSQYVFQGLDDSGKLMGLAPYGGKGRFDFEIFRLEQGRVLVNYNWLDRFVEPCRDDQQFKANFSYYADLAWWVQCEIERALFYLFRDRREKCVNDNLCYAGGVALNAVANGKLLASQIFKNTYIQPAAGDNGLAIGCAYYGWLEVLGKERVVDSSTTFFGQKYPPDRGDRAADRFLKWLLPIECDDYLEKTAELLASGKIVGWYQDGSEFGPRALGNRSILADPRSASVRERINRDVKFREDFRPFAPSVLLEDLPTYFDSQQQDPYMLTVVSVKPSMRELIPSVTHEDGSARIQTVSLADNPNYYRLIQRFKDLSGVGLILNTSLNRRGMPIVETPEQAFQFFLTTGLEVLVVNGRIFEKSPTHTLCSIRDLSAMERLLTKACGEHKKELKAIGGRVALTISGQWTWYIDYDESEFHSDLDTPKPDGALRLTSSEFEVLRRSTEMEIREALRAGRLQVEGDVDKAIYLLLALNS